MKVDTFKCDVCSTVKGEGNHWFKFRSYPDEGNGAEFIVNEWNSEGYPLIEKHACSDECVGKLVQQWLSSQKEKTQ